MDRDKQKWENYGKAGFSHRVGITLMQLGKMFLDEASAHQWVDLIVWQHVPKSTQRCSTGAIHESIVQHVYRYKHEIQQAQKTRPNQVRF